MRKMNKNISQRTALGITQEELAILLKIPMSLIGMYETGKRDLPSSAGLQLTLMYIHLLDKQKQAFVYPDGKNENAKMVSLLKDKLEKNEALQWKLGRNIEEMKSKYEKGIANLYLAEYFEAKEKETDELSERHAGFLHHLANKKLDQNGPGAQIKLIIKLKTLKAEHGILKEELNSLTASVK